MFNIIVGNEIVTQADEEGLLDSKVKSIMNMIVVPADFDMDQYIGSYGWIIEVL
jgi:hypothetical protein